MLGIFGIILILILFVVLFVIAILGSFIRTIFGLGKRATKAFTGEKTSSNHTQSTYSSAQSTQASDSSNGKKKIFADDEGEYVEFEEVK